MALHYTTLHTSISPPLPPLPRPPPRLIPTGISRPMWESDGTSCVCSTASARRCPCRSYYLDPVQSVALPARRCNLSLKKKQKDPGSVLLHYQREARAQMAAGSSLGVGWWPTLRRGPPCGIYQSSRGGGGGGSEDVKWQASPLSSSK